MTMTTPMTGTGPTGGELAAAALAYAAAGIPVFPVHTPIPHDGRAAGCSCSRRVCPDPGKHPRTRRGLYDATTDPATVARWWRRWPAANIGARTGVLFDVCDVDGAAAAAELRGLLAPDRWPPGPIAATGRDGGGWHLLVRPTGHGNPVNLLPGLDWRGHNGYVVLPPSTHPSGRRYTWQHPLAGPIPAAPAALVALLARPAPTPPSSASSLPPPSADRARRWALGALHRAAAEVAAAPAPAGDGPGRRNHTLNRAAFKLGQLVREGLLTNAEIAAVLLAAADACGLDHRKAQTTIKLAMSAGIRKPSPYLRRPR